MVGEGQCWLGYIYFSTELKRRAGGWVKRRVDRASGICITARGQSRERGYIGKDYRGYILTATGELAPRGQGFWGGGMDIFLDKRKDPHVSMGSILAGE